MDKFGAKLKAFGQASDLPKSLERRLEVKKYCLYGLAREPHDNTETCRYATVKIKAETFEGTSGISMWSCTALSRVEVISI